MIDHPYQPGGPFGRCAEPGCNRKKASHRAVQSVVEAAADMSRTAEAEAWRYDTPPPTPMPAFEPGVPEPIRRFDPVTEDTLKVIFRKRVGIGRHGEPVTINWPTGWPLPVIGQAVMVGGDLGRVRDVTFDIDKDCIQLNCD